MPHQCFRRHHPTLPCRHLLTTSRPRLAARPLAIASCLYLASAPHPPRSPLPPALASLVPSSASLPPSPLASAASARSLRYHHLPARPFSIASCLYLASARAPSRQCILPLPCQRAPSSVLATSSCLYLTTALATASYSRLAGTTPSTLFTVLLCSCLAFLFTELHLSYCKHL